MNISQETFNAALLVHTEFGPDLRIPRLERLSSCFPKLSPEIVEALIELFERLQHSAFDIAVAHCQGTLAKDQGIQKTAELHPLLSSEGTARLWGRAMYYAMREGY